tara:strand:+ start:473 stop:1045 length:573 start_codon:yes stop_codon:yes gene_type:complete
MRFTVIDTETTGLAPLRSTILEIAIVTVEDGWVVDRWSSKVKPTDEDLVLADPKALEINGYAADPSAWDDAPSWDVVGVAVADKLSRTMPVGHNVSFDLRMIREVNRRHKIKVYVPFRGVDTMTLAIEHLATCGLKRFGLDAVRRWLGWSLEGAHTAARDAEDTTKLFLLLHRATWWTRLRVRLGRWWRQ